MLEWLFRPQCAACGAAIPERAALCGACAASLLELGPACPRCAEPTLAPDRASGEPAGEDARATPDRASGEPAGEDARETIDRASGEPAGEDARETIDPLCGRCRAAPLPLERIVAPWRFGGQLATAIRRLKFAGKTHVARDLAPLWAPLIAAAAAADGVVVPVPLHWRRRLARGYDQTWLLARHACAAAGLPPPVPALRRTRAAPPQSTLPAHARRDNLRGAFAVRIPDAIAGRAVILVDDVVTTGATLAAAAGPLHAAGAAGVIGVALARATSAPG
jgi:ComF family protein